MVEVSKYDQYAIKVSGSGRLTTRNRRFLGLITMPDKPTTQIPLGPHPTTQTTPFKCYQRQPEISAPTLVDTETLIGAQSKSQLPHGLSPVYFRYLPPNFSTRSSASVDPRPHTPESELSHDFRLVESFSPPTLCWSIQIRRPALELDSNRGTWVTKRSSF